MNYDLVVVGGGLAGLFAAARAAELGVPKIAIFEKGPVLGGNGKICRTFVSPYFSNYGSYESDENDIKLYRRAMKELHQTGNPELIQRYLFGIKHVVKWLEERGVDEKWKPVTAGGPFKSDCSMNVETDPEAAGTNASIGKIICDLLIEICKKSPSVEIFTKSQGIKLLTDDIGDVNGVIVMCDGRETGVSCKKLVLSCGGVGGSFESLIKYLPAHMQPGDYINMGGVRTCTGDGIAMAAAIGAEIGKDMNIHLLGPGYAGSHASTLRGLATDPRSFVVNKEGKRVIDESMYRDAQALCNRSPGKVLYTIYGKHSCETTWEEVGDGSPATDICKNFKADILAGHLLVVPNLTQAAEFLGCDPKVLETTVKRYDESCKSAHDDHMLKDPKYLLPLGGPPYYILHCVRSMDSTQGGITVNKNFEALTPDGKPIGGMYVLGDHVTGFVSDYYGPGGAGMTFAMSSGFLAGQDAAKYCV